MKRNKVQAQVILILIAVAVLLTATVLGLVCGSVSIPLRELIWVVLGEDRTSQSAMILWNVRLPRVLGGILAGAGLGSAGVILQGVMNNSLASPNTIGVNSGAGFFVMLSMVLFPKMLFMKSLMAFLGAFITSIVILLLAYYAEKSRITIVLAGIAISSFLSAGMNVMKLLDTELNMNGTQFLTGSLSGITMKMIQIPAIGIVVGIVAAVILAKALNMLGLGDGIAGALGLHVNYFRILFVMLASILSGLVVSFSGLVGFVGLIVPHICRHLFGHDARLLIPMSAILGAAFVLFSDMLGRVLFAPYEIPVGIILSLIGGPFFLYLLLRKGGRRVHA